MTDPETAEHQAPPPGPEPARPKRSRAASRWKKARSTALVFVAQPFVGLVARLPLGIARRLARGLASLAFLVFRRERRRAMANLRAALGEKTEEAEIRRLARQVFVNAGESIAELFILMRWPPDAIERRFGLRGDVRALEEAVRGGAVGLTAHFGNWEFLGVIMARFAPGLMMPVANRNSNARFQSFLDRLRRDIGLSVIYTDEPPRRLLEAVREGHLLGLLPDQNLRTPNGVFVEFFGRLAYTTTLPVNLVRSTKKPMVLVLLAREGEGFRLVVRQIAMTWTGDRREDFLRNTQAWSSALEEEIRKAPGQWMWIHDRWRTQPGDERRMVRVRWSRKARRRRRKAMELGTQGAGDSRPTAE